MTAVLSAVTIVVVTHHPLKEEPTMITITKTITEYGSGIIDPRTVPYEDRHEQGIESGIINHHVEVTEPVTLTLSADEATEVLGLLTSAAGLAVVDLRQSDATALRRIVRIVEIMRRMGASEEDIERAI